MTGACGVFSVQPSSGQGIYGVSNADEVRLGISVADVAQCIGVRHLVYSFSNAAGSQTGVGHLDSKSQIEVHIRRLPIHYTIVRPSTFIKLLLLPDFGLERGTVTLFTRPNQAMQFIGVKDIGQLVTRIFTDGNTHHGRTLELVGDWFTRTEIAVKFSQVLHKSVAYQRFPDVALHKNDTLRGLTRLVDKGPLADRADIDNLRNIYPALLTFDACYKNQRVGYQRIIR